jgi:hypothetical protein
MLHKVLVVSHELSKPAEMDDYLARVLNPVNPLIIWGRSKDADPPCKPHECMWYLWKDECKAPYFLVKCPIIHMFVGPQKSVHPFRVFVSPHAHPCTEPSMAVRFASKVVQGFIHCTAMGLLAKLFRMTQSLLCSFLGAWL